MQNDIIHNIAYWRERLGNAAGRYDPPEICAVTKTVDADTVSLAYDAGIRVIGENRVQELMGKLERLDRRYEIHLIGRLQTNKARQIIGTVRMVQSLDRQDLAAELNRRAMQLGATLDCLAQVNIGLEPQKGGFAPDDVIPFLKRMDDFPALRVKGLMAILPVADDADALRPLFRQMRGLFERIRDMDMPSVRMETLSMGMTDDCLVAASEGATMVRLGRALFGARA